MYFDGARNRNPTRCRLPGIGNGQPALSSNSERCICIDSTCTDLLQTVVSKGVAGFEAHTPNVDFHRNGGVA